MGYELDRLKEQYGVSSPTPAFYAGPAAPVVPTMPTKPAKNSQQPAANRSADYANYGYPNYGGSQPRNEEPIKTSDPQAEYIKQKAAYDAYVADPSAFNELMRKYELGQREYNQYREDLSNRMANTPMYGAEYNIGLKGESEPVTYNKPLQQPTYGAFNAATLSKPAEDVANYYTRMRDIGYTDKDIYDTVTKSAGKTGVYNLGRALSEYNIPTELPKMNWDKSFGSIPSSTDTTVIPQGPGYEAYWMQPSTTPQTNQQFDDQGNLLIMKHGGAVHDMARRYNVGGNVRKFKTGGNEGVEEDDLEARFQAALRGESDADAVVNEARQRMSPVVEPPPPTATMPPTETAPVTTSPAVQPVVPPPATTTPVSPAAADLMSMLSRYDDKESVYGPELQAARKRATAETSAFTDMISKAMQGDAEKPSKAELYFRLAAAFGSPTKTGAFGENLALASKEMADYSKDVRTAAKADKQLRMQLALEAQKIKAQTAREDLTTLRSLAGEEMKDKRALLTEYIKSGRPQSEAGKAAVDSGLKQGTPEFTEFVNKYIDDKIRSGNLLKEAMVAIAAGNLQVAQGGLDVRRTAEQRQQVASGKLTPKEVDLKVQAETNLGGLDDSISSLKRAYELNPQTFDGTILSTTQRKLLEQTDPKDPRVLASREQSNLLSKGAIDKLRSSFGGNPTEGERAALLALEGIDSKSKEERSRIMKNTYKLLKTRREREAARLEEIKRGAYRETSPEPAGGIE